MSSESPEASDPAVLAEGERGAVADRAVLSLIARYPELHPVLEQAVNAAVYTFEIDEDLVSDLVHDLEDVIAADLIAAYAPFVAIAVQTARTVESSRAARLLEAARSAQTMAERVAEAATAMQSRGDQSANVMALAASDAAHRMASSVAIGGEAAAASAAAKVATAVHHATLAKAKERAEAAAVAAAEAAAAAAQVVESADLQNVINELKIFDAATAVQEIALATCHQAALNSAVIEAARKPHLRERRHEI